MPPQLESRPGEIYQILYEPEHRIFISRFRFDSAPDLLSDAKKLDEVFSRYMQDLEAFAARLEQNVGHVVDVGEFLTRATVEQRQAIGDFIRRHKDRIVMGAYVSTSPFIRIFLTSLNMFMRRQRKAFADPEEARRWLIEEMKKKG